MNIIIEIIAELFLALFGVEISKACGDRGVPKLAKVIFLIIALSFIAGSLFFCWKVSKW